MDGLRKELMVRDHTLNQLRRSLENVRKTNEEVSAFIHLVLCLYLSLLFLATGVEGINRTTENQVQKDTGLLCSNKGRYVFFSFYGSVKFSIPNFQNCA